VQENHGLAIEMQTDPAMDPEGEDLTVLLFQSIRELLLNEVKHAKVKSARLDMVRDDENRLHVTISDRGPGFDSDTIWEKAQAGTGFGLLSIRERLKLLGGRFEIESTPGKGAAFTLIVPLETTREKDEKRIEKIIAEIHSAKTASDKIRVLLADDHTVVRQGLSTMLNLHSDVEVVGEAADGEEAVAKARKLQPDVILLDISMPKMNGVEATRTIHAEFPHIRIIVLSMYDKDDRAAQMIEAGASAYCTKDGAADVLLSAIRGEAEAG
jgi:CheY-like chemotaxis protein